MSVVTTPPFSLSSCSVRDNLHISDACGLGLLLRDILRWTRGCQLVRFRIERRVDIENEVGENLGLAKTYSGDQPYPHRMPSHQTA